MARRTEVFTAGCPLCNDTLKMVREATKDCGCEIIERRCGGEVCGAGRIFTSLLIGFLFRNSILDLISILDKIKYGFMLGVLFFIAAFISFKLFRGRLLGRPDLRKLILILRTIKILRHKWLRILMVRIIIYICQP